MGLTAFQLGVCRLLAGRRKQSGESYVAGGAALLLLADAPRISRDIDVFHDVAEAVAFSYEADRETLEAQGYEVQPVREREAFVEALISHRGDRVRLQWAPDSAFRFFPLVEHADLGLVLHPFDLATNKVLALVGRLEARDWVDVITCNDEIQELGYLAWAACGKDPGFSPVAILEHAARSARYSEPEIQALAFEGEAPTAAALSRRWHEILDQAREIVAALPAAEAGHCVLVPDGTLFRGDPTELDKALAEGAVRFHRGSIGGALPRLRGPQA